MAPAAVPPTLVPARPSPRFQRAQSPAPGPLPSPRLCCLASTSFSSVDIPASRACVRNACSGQARPRTPSSELPPLLSCQPHPQSGLWLPPEARDLQETLCKAPRGVRVQMPQQHPPSAWGIGTDPSYEGGRFPRQEPSGVAPWLQAVGLCPTVLKNLSTVSCLHVSPCHSG